MISVIICTYNASESLKKTLDSLIAQQSIECLGYEIIVVDNNSKDNTKATVESYIEKSNRKIRYVFEPKQGKTFALNTGIRHAQGEIIAFTDQDVIVDTNWIKNIDFAFRNHHCDALVGKVLLSFQEEKPQWLSERFMKSLAWVDFGNFPTILNNKQACVGSNMAFKTNLFLKFGLFDHRLGPGKAGTLEDVEFSERIRKQGAILYYFPNIIVHHIIPKRRTTKKYFRNNYFVIGYSDYYIDNNKSHPLKLFLYCVKIITKNLLNAFFSIRNEEKKLWFECQICSNLGYIKGILSQYINRDSIKL